MIEWVKLLPGVWLVTSTDICQHRYLRVLAEDADTVLHSNRSLQSTLSICADLAKVCTRPSTRDGDGDGDVGEHRLTKKVQPVLGGFNRFPPPSIPCPASLFCRSWPCCVPSMFARLIFDGSLCSYTLSTLQPAQFDLLRLLTHVSI